MNFLLFDHHGAFVLFGSKPMSQALLTPSMSKAEAEKLRNSLPEELKNSTQYVEYPYDAYACWNVWKKYSHCFPMRGFMLVERKLIVDPSVLEIYLINIPNTVKILEKHKVYFSRVAKRAFDPTVEVYTIGDMGSAFWKALLSDTVSQGILFGYGKANSQRFANELAGNRVFKDFPFSTSKQIGLCKASKHNFTIPKFRTHSKDLLPSAYRKEMKQIQEIYSRGDGLEITLKKLEAGPK